jgi:hypothetical protein
MSGSSEAWAFKRRLRPETSPPRQCESVLGASRWIAAIYRLPKSSTGRRWQRLKRWYPAARRTRKRCITWAQPNDGPVPRRASETFMAALEALESQKAKVGGGQEARTRFGARYQDYYRDSVETLLELNDPTRAFLVVERSRARALLTMLAERDLVFAADVPAELTKERQVLSAQYDRAQAAMGRMNPATQREQIDKQRTILRDLRARQDDLKARIVKHSPRFASLQYPEPLSLAAAQATLDPGTVLLCYSVAEGKTSVLAV